MARLRAPKQVQCPCHWHDGEEFVTGNGHVPDAVTRARGTPPRTPTRPATRLLRLRGDGQAFQCHPQ
eukprot:12899696-Prorocentrum_lima.AAC.1